jgi:hypothetical protein
MGEVVKLNSNAAVAWGALFLPRTTGHAIAAPPRTLMTSRLLMPTIGSLRPLGDHQHLTDPRVQSVCRRVSVAQVGRQVLGAVLKCSEI